ncbi:MAG: sigma 54-interacting transcriptional regulator [Candidatus Latescibacteria bacterium]|nr:sigma 54-interacting transcriptional regulator [Candidatus Latescibacterota bacterium]
MTAPVAFLRSLDYLQKVPDDLIQKIAKDMQAIDIPAGTTLFHEGDEGDAVYIVVDGILSIERDDTPVVTRGPGELVGEFALLDNHSRSATVIAASDARLFKWLRTDFTDVLSQNVMLVWGILTTIIEKARQSTTAQYETIYPGKPTTPATVTLPGSDWVPEKRLVYQSAPMRQIFDLIRKIEHSTSSVLITGESGTGKEMVARAIHHASPYRDGPFVALNCGALPETLAESELFGQERGSFTGSAREQQGKIELAHQGTLFLDEISELPPSLQVKLLRVLDDRRVLHLGGTRPIVTEFRVIAATNRDLAQEIREGHFREDLFYRLAVITIHIPPLRQRLDDILPLAEHFLSEISNQFGQPKVFGPRVLEYLQRQPWKGNVRELRNAIERAVMVSEGNQIELGDIRLPGQPSPDRGRYPLEAASTGGLENLLQHLNLRDAQTNVLELVEKILMELALAQTNGNMSQAAKLLGLNYKQVTRRLKKYGG